MCHCVFAFLEFMNAECCVQRVEGMLRFETGSAEKMRSIFGHSCNLIHCHQGDGLLRKARWAGVES